jgi:hypothetical protein
MPARPLAKKRACTTILEKKKGRLASEVSANYGRDADLAARRRIGESIVPVRRWSLLSPPSPSCRKTNHANDGRFAQEKDLSIKKRVNLVPLLCAETLLPSFFLIYSQRPVVVVSSMQVIVWHATQFGIERRVAHSEPTLSCPAPTETPCAGVLLRGAASQPTCPVAMPLTRSTANFNSSPSLAPPETLPSATRTISRLDSRVLSGHRKEHILQQQQPPTHDDVVLGIFDKVDNHFETLERLRRCGRQSALTATTTTTTTTTATTTEPGAYPDPERHQAPTLPPLSTNQ